MTFWLLIGYVVISAFWLGLLIGDRDPTWRTFGLAAIWPLIIVTFLGSLAADKVIPMHHVTVDGTAAWKQGVRFTTIIGTKHTRLFLARSPKPKRDDIDGSGA